MKLSFVVKRNHTCHIHLNQSFDRVLKRLLEESRCTSVVVFYDSRIKKRIKKISKNQKYRIHFCELHVSENLKSLNSVKQIYRKLLNFKVDRKTILVSVGGGVMGDTIGFVAATYLRGLRWINISTTVLAQVDSGVGGKTGVNLRAGKNLVGCIYQPTDVIIDYSFLKTLNEREKTSGLGEVLKYSFLDSKISFPVKFKKVEQEKILRKLIPLCVRYKMKVVQADEEELLGIRQYLNLGHTFGHVLETYTHYKKYRHGEAVLWGLKFAAIVSFLMEKIGFQEFRKILIKINQLPVKALPPRLDPLKCYKLALKDKKNRSGYIQMVLFSKNRLVVDKVSQDTFKRAIQTIGIM